MKKLREIIFIVLCFVMLTGTCHVCAKAGSYSGTYSMKAGLYCKRTIDIKSKLTVTVTPNSYKDGTSGVKLTVWTAKKNFLGNWTPGTEVCSGPSTSQFTKTWKHKGKIQGLYFMNPTHQDVWKGTFKLSWD